MKKDIEIRQEHVLKDLKGEWIGVTSIKGINYATKFNFLDATKGTRTLYYLEEGNECSIEQNFKPYFPPSVDVGDRIAYTFSLKMNINCDNPPANFNSNNKKIVTGGSLSLKYKKPIFTLTNFQRKIERSDIQKEYEELRLIKKVYELAEDFSKKVKSQSYSMVHPKFKISTVTGDVTYLGYEDFEFGKIILNTDNSYIFNPQQWVNDANFTLYGKIQDITYIAPNGMEKRGDLDICFYSKDEGIYAFREIQK